MKKNNYPLIVKCFRCGETDFHSEYDLDTIQVCESCGERGIISFQMALDIINSLYQDGGLENILDHYIEVPDDLEELDFD